MINEKNIDYQIVFRSLFLSLLEKTNTLKNNSKHLRRVIYFFSKNDDNIEGRAYIPSHLREDINNFILDLDGLDNKINFNLKEISSNIHNEEIIHYLIEYNKFNNQIESLLSNSFKSIAKKVFQIKEETFNNYLPRPLVGRMYSTKGFLDHLENAINQFLNKVDEEKKIVYYWDYLDAYRTNHHIDHSYGKDINSYVQLAFWYHDSLYLPAITHELMHICLETNSAKKIDFMKTVFEMKNEMTKEFEKTTYKNAHIKTSNKLVDEIISDYFAYLLHGNSYIITLFHLLIGKEFEDSFGNFNIAPMTFRLKREWIVIRLKVLTEISLISYNLDPTTNDDDEELLLYINTIRKIVEDIYPDDNDKSRNNSSLYKIYSEYHHNYFDEYLDVNETYVNFLVKKSVDTIANFDRNLINLLSKIIKELEKDSLKDSPNFYSYLPLDKLDFNKLWANYIKNLKNITTKDLNNNDEVLYNTKHDFRKIMFKDSVYKKNIFKFQIGKSFELKYYKINIESMKDFMDNRDSDNYNNEIIKFINEKNNLVNKYNTNSVNNTSPHIVLDIYHYLTITEEKIKFAPNIKNDNSAIEKSKNNLKYFTQNHSLIQIIKKKTQQYTEEYSTRKPLSILVHIQLMKNSFNQIFDCCDEIYEYFNKKNIISFDIYKSLGPQDLVINIKGISSRELYKIKEDFSHITNVKRTLTVPYLGYRGENNNYEDIILTNNKKSFTKFSTHIRFNKIDKNSQLKLIHEVNEFHNEIENIYIAPGVLDAEILWKKTSMGSIFKLTTKIYESNLATDIQTKIKFNAKSWFTKINTNQRKNK